MKITKRKLVTIIEGMVNKRLLKEWSTSEGDTWRSIFRQLEYDNFDEFIGDNPGAGNVMREWILEIPEFVEKLKAVGDKETLESWDFYDIIEDEEY